MRPSFLAPSAVSSQHNKAVIDYLVGHFLKGSAVQAGSKPGFAHALQLSYQTLDPTLLSVGPNSLTYRYKTCPRSVPSLSLGLLTALMDELTTTAVFRVGLPSPPGVSLHFYTERVAESSARAPQKLEEHTELDIVNTVTKLGKTVAHTRTEFRCPQTTQLLAISSHIKYMPTGSPLLDWAFSSPWAQAAYHQLYVKSAPVPVYEQRSLPRDVIGKYLTWADATTQADNHHRQHPPVQASFTVTPLHTNPLGSMHGGCHAVVMETVATRYAQVELAQQGNQTASQLDLQSLQVQFLSAAKLGTTVDVICETIAKQVMKPTSSTHGSPPFIHVRVQLRHGERTLSEATMYFTSRAKEELVKARL